MGCVIKYKGQSIPEEQFLQYLNKQIATNNLFNENETLANSVYETLGFIGNISDEQKQQAQQAYSQYLEQNPNGIIEGFKDFVQGKQFQKLTAEEKAKTIEQVTKEHRSIGSIQNSKELERVKKEIANLRDANGNIASDKISKFNRLSKLKRFLELPIERQVERAIEDFVNKNNLTDKQKRYLNSLSKIRDSFKEIVEKLQELTSVEFVKSEFMDIVDSNNQSIQEIINSDISSINNLINEKSVKAANNLDIEINREYSANELDDFVQKYGSKQVKFIWNLIKSVAQKLGVKTRFSLEGQTTVPVGYMGHYAQGQIDNRASLLQTPDVAARVIVHELIHGVTNYIIDAVKNNKQDVIKLLTQKQINAVKKLSNLLKQLQSDNNTKDYYGSKNEDEILAELTHDGFVEALKNKELNFVERLLDYILDILGINTNAYEEALQILKDLIENPIQYKELNLVTNNSLYSKLSQEELNQTINEVTKKHRSVAALKDLSAKLAWRTGGKIKFENNSSLDWKGYNQGMISVLNKAHMTPDTPFHEILAHPIIRAIKNRTSHYKTGETAEFHGYGEPYRVTIEKIYDDTLEADIIDGEGNKQKVDLFELNKTQNTLLYQNLLKELETGRGKEVFEQVKRDYNRKKPLREKPNPHDSDYLPEENQYEPRYYSEQDYLDDLELWEQERDDVNNKYTLEEQQEEAIVTLLGELAAGKLEKKENATLKKKLLEFWKQISDFVRQLLLQDEIRIDELPITTTLNDLAEIMAYGNNKIILPGYKIEYSTPLGNKYDTLEEVNNEIRGLADANVEVDLSGVKIPITKINTIEDVKNLIESKQMSFVFGDISYIDGEFIGRTLTDKEGQKIPDEEVIAEAKRVKRKSEIEAFIEKNKEYEQSKEIIEQWKKENNIQYDPEEVYSRGQEFYHIKDAYFDSARDTELWVQGLLGVLDDYERAGTRMELSFATAPQGEVGKGMRGMPEARENGALVYITAYPQSEDIIMASKVDNNTSSFGHLNGLEKAFTNRDNTITGIALTKSVPLHLINTIEPNLADTIDDVAHHNESVIALTKNNFRIHYGENVAYEVKQIIDKFNKILDDKYGKLEKPEVKKQGEKIVQYGVYSKGANDILGWFDTKEEAQAKVDESNKQLTYLEVSPDYSVRPITRPIGKQPTQTRENTISIQDVEKGLTTLVKYYNAIDNNNGAIVATGTKEEIAEQLKKYPDYNDYTLEEGEVERRDFKDKEYTKQAETNLKIAALKEVARKYPRSLITSKVVPINPNLVDSNEIQYSKIDSKQVTESLNKLNTHLENYLKQFGFNTEQLNDLRQVSGYSIIGATDFLEKTIFVQKENINKAYSKEAAYTIFNLLGRKNLLRKDLIASIHLIDNYEDLKSKYTNSKLFDYNIRELIAVDYLQSKLIEAHKEALPTTNKAVSKDVTAKNKLEYTILKIKKWWSDIIRNFFKSYKRGYIEDVFNQIANDVINNNTRLFNLSKEVSYKKMELKGNQKEINDNLVKLGAINSGSYSLNRQGNLTRESVNDLDYFLPYQIKDDFIKNVVKKYPQAIFSEPYSGVMGNRSLTLSLKIDGVKIDFFLPTSQEESDKNKIIIIDGVKHHHWKHIFDAKIRIGSQKHLSDLAGFSPFNREWSVYNVNWRNPLVLKDDYLNIVGQRHYNFDFIQSKYNSKEYSSDEQVTQSDNIKTYWDKNLEHTALNYFKDSNIDFEKSIQYQDLLSYFNNNKHKAIVAYYLTFSENFKKFYGNIDSRRGLPSYIINSISGNYSKNSILLDENNEPVIFYHGAGTMFDKFSKDYFLSGEGAMAYGAGFYATNYKPTADNYRDTAKAAMKTFRKLLEEQNKELLELIAKLKININEENLTSLMMGSVSVEDTKSKTELLNLLGLTETKALYVALTNPLYWQKDISKENKNLIESHFSIKLENNNSGRIYRELEKTLKISDKELSARLYQIGIDGVINIAGGGQAVGGFSHKKGEKHVIFFEPIQAKAVNNSGLFSLNNENMYDPIEVKEKSITSKVVPINPNLGDSNENNTSKEYIKPGVTELFNENPELANKVYETLGFTGNISLEQKQQAQQLYSQYLDTLTDEPIVYKGFRNKAGIVHNTPNHSYFTNSFKIANAWYKNEEGIKTFVVPKVRTEFFKADTSKGVSTIKPQEENFINSSKAGLIKLETNDIGGWQIQHVVNKSIIMLELGSKQDIDGFSKFVSNDFEALEQRRETINPPKEIGIIKTLKANLSFADRQKCN